MTIQMLPLWELVLDGIQVLLCAVILFFLIHNKIKYRRLILNTSPKEYAAEFSNEMRLQHLKQETEKVFDSIVDVINRERGSLQKHYDSDEPNHRMDACVLPGPAEINADRPVDKQSEEDAAEFGEIFSLSEKGLSTREISQRVSMPRGEVELVLRLNKEMRNN